MESGQGSVQRGADHARCLNRGFSTSLSMLLQGDFHHWVSLFNFFDAYLETHVQNRADLQLKCESDQTLSPLPSRNLKAILKATAQILENCSNKHLYSSCEVRLAELSALKCYWS